MADPSSLFECSPRGNAAAAWALAEAALRLKPEDAHAWLLRGRSAWLAGRCVEAREAWRHAVALAPQDPAAWFLYILYILSGPPDLRPEPAVAVRSCKVSGFSGGTGAARRAVGGGPEVV
jgi:predicted TPR repeat methyltransferase